MVFEILNENELTHYYTIDDRPGINRRDSGKEQYGWLDDPDIAAQLVDFQDEKITRITLKLPQIHCASCIWLLEHLYRLQPGIVQSTINFLKKEAYVSFEHDSVNLRQVAELLAAIGYPPQLNLDSLSDEQNVKAVDRTLYYQLGVAGFAFGNIMLLSFPEYLGLGEGRFQTWFGYINIALALPVLLFSARPYLLSAWHGLRERHLNIDVPITLGIITLFGRSVYEILSHSGTGYLDSLAGLVFFLLIGKWFQQATYHRLSFERDYKSYFPIAASVLTEDGEISVAVNKLEIGSNIKVRHQELIPADGILLRGKGFIDYSFVTGESQPVEKKSGEKIFAGGRQMGDAIEVTIVKKVSQSYLTQLWNDSVFEKQDVKQGASDLADAVGKKFTYVILGIAILTLAYWLPKDIGYAINAFTAVLIIACPCAVALSVPFTFGNIIRFMARQGCYLKNTLVIENLARVNTIVFDKTGTITQASNSNLTYEGTPLSIAEKTYLSTLTNQSSHPVSKQIYSFLGQGENPIDISSFSEATGEGVRGTIDGHTVILKKHVRGTAAFIDGVERGVFIMANQYRKGFTALIGKWKDTFRMFVLSGDQANEKKYLEQFFPSDQLLFDQNPKDKLQFVDALKAKNSDTCVLMIGDGLNDAGALQRSDVGIVIAEDTNNFTPACDAILDAANFESLPDLIQLAKKSITVVYMSYGLAALYNIVGLSYAVQGTLSPVIAAILMPLSSITIVLFGVGVSSLIARKQFK
jgi:Cu+-exporting ATPase